MTGGRNGGGRQVGSQSQRREEDGRKTREVDDEETWETAVSTFTTGSGQSNT